MFINDGVFNNHVKNTKKHIPFVATSNSGNTYSIQIDDLDHLEDGQAIMVKFNAASTGAISVSVNGGTAKSVVDYFGNAVTNIRAGLIAHLVYSADDSNFQLQGKGGDGDALITDIRQGKKATTREGLITGVLPVQATAAQEVVPGTSDIVKPAGIYDGDITIKGITITPGDSPFYKSTDIYNTAAEAYANLMKIRYNGLPGSVKLTFHLSRVQTYSGPAVGICYARVKINSAWIGQVFQAGDSTGTDCEEIINVNDQDILEIWGFINERSNSEEYCHVANIIIAANLPYITEFN